MARKMERVKGIEPSSKAWEAFVLPLNYTRADVFVLRGCVLVNKCNAPSPNLSPKTGEREEDGWLCALGVISGGGDEIASGPGIGVFLFQLSGFRGWPDIV